MKNSKGKEEYHSVLKGIATKASETCDYLYISEWFGTNHPQFTITQSSGRYCNFDGTISLAGVVGTYEAKGRWKVDVNKYSTAFIDVEKIKGLNGIIWDVDSGHDNDKRTLFILYPDSNVILSYDARWIERNVKHHIRNVKDSVLQGESGLRGADVYEIPIPPMKTDEQGNKVIESYERDVWLKDDDGKNEKIHYEMKDERGQPVVKVMNQNMKEYYEIWQLFYDNMKVIYDERTAEIQKLNPDKTLHI